MVKWKKGSGKEHLVATGRLGYSRDYPQVTAETIYDIASLTKIFTTTVILKLVSEGKLNLDHDIGQLLSNQNYSGIKIEHILGHVSGLNQSFSAMKDLSAEEIKEKIATLRPEEIPGSQVFYTNAGFYLLGKVLEKAEKWGLPEIFERELFAPLGMTHTMFNPPAILREKIAPTEDDDWRKKLIRGEVHDEGTWKLGGVTGYAGLFSTADDLMRLGKLWLGQGKIGVKQLIDKDLISRATRLSFPDAVNKTGNYQWHFGWGWRINNRSKMGRYVSDRAYEFSGFTGPILAADPKKSLVVVIMTNRIHPKRVPREKWETACRKVIEEISL